MMQIAISNLTFAYPGAPAPLFKELSLRIDTDWKLGLVGRNGRGKTTLLDLIQGKYEYQGTITPRLQTRRFPAPSVDEERDALALLDSRCPDRPLWVLKRELSRLQCPEEILSRPFKTLSHGERTKVLLASLFLEKDVFALIDEPTDHLDAEARAVVVDYLRSKRGFILVSHDRTLLDDCVDHILALNRSGVELQKGNFSSWFRNRELQDGMERDLNEKLEREMGRMKEASRRTAEWSDRVERSKRGALDKGFVGHKAAKMMKRSKNLENRREAAIETKRGLLRNVETTQALQLRPLRYHAQTLVRVSGVSIRYGDRVACRDVGFEVGCGERVALIGGNGTGKSSILKLIEGKDLDFCGELHRASGLSLSCVPQDTSFLRGRLSDYARREGLDESLVRALLEKMDLVREKLDVDMSELSQGQKKKVLIAVSLSRSAHLYIWDEPLNFVDVFSRIQIEELLLTFKPALLFVEHDRAFVGRIATKVITMQPTAPKSFEKKSFERTSFGDSSRHEAP